MVNNGCLVIGTALVSLKTMIKNDNSSIIYKLSNGHHGVMACITCHCIMPQVQTDTGSVYQLVGSTRVRSLKDN